MAIKGFLLQGFTAQTHLAAVKRVLACPDLDKAILSIAFVNKAVNRTGFAGGSNS